MVDAMNRGRLAAAEVTLAAKTLTTSEGTSEWGVHQSLVDSLRKALVEEFGRKVLADKIRPDPPNRGKNLCGRDCPQARGTIKETKGHAALGGKIESNGRRNSRMVSRGKD